MIRARLSVLALPLLLAVACSGGGGGGGNTLRLSEFKFDPNTLTAKAGQPVQVTLQNAGTVEHDFNIDQFNIHSVKVQPGRSENFTFTAPAAGTYQFVCNEAGHKEGGMTGTLTVQ